ncbi:hypothetical protein BX257_1414 [Streptomyces sp. 3212.3]|nr:hypothetical protein BX257_1414 [Streptomyces sp. 3212.3]
MPARPAQTSKIAEGNEDGFSLGPAKPTGYARIS